jgi:hypothetical protein
MLWKLIVLELIYIYIYIFILKNIKRGNSHCLRKKENLL